MIVNELKKCCVDCWDIDTKTKTEFPASTRDSDGNFVPAPVTHIWCAHRNVCWKYRGKGGGCCGDCESTYTYTGDKKN